ncbi:MAG: DNA translocase FtsK 4TM domain-containing protein [Candidatus Caldatribacteriota bacterium]|nr:DNA translocase FtsK 4TM domain-containing protein [Candidatus Caldatribacteriota bacterium]
MKRKNTKNKVFGIIIVSFSLLYILSYIFMDKMGIFGNIITETTSQFIGIGAYLLPFILLFMGFILIFDLNIKSSYRKIFALSLLFIIFLTFIHLKLLLLGNAYSLSKSGAGGGMLGYFISNSLFLYFGLSGAYLVLISLSMISALFLSESSYFEIFKIIVSESKTFTVRVQGFIKKASIKTKEKSSPKIIYHINNKIKSEEIHGRTVKKEFKEEAKPSQEIFDFTGDRKKGEDIKYNLPPLSLISQNSMDAMAASKSKINIEQNIKTLENTFINFGIKAKVTGVTRGPSVTQYEIQPAPGVKISKITNLSNDIALAFAVASVRIEAPIPGKNAIGIEVPNIKRTKVYLKEILGSNELSENHYKLPLALGLNIGGKPIIADLTKLPHLLIAGATGSGKSVCINNIILSILYNLNPKQVKFIMIDPKRVELNVYNGIPHLSIPIITDKNQATKVLNWAISEMERRFKIFAQVGVRNMQGYNEYVQNIKKDMQPLPYIVIIVDELADLMLSAPVKVEESLCRLAQMTRATGIHLIIATQRPSVDIITGSIKVNFPSRIAFAVSTQVDSRTILDVNGAEKLLGNGDMLFSPVGAPKPIRAQGAFVNEKEIRKVVNFLKENYFKSEEEQDAFEMNKMKNSIIDLDVKEKKEEEGEIDELFQDAVSVIINNNQASISILQRKLRIGYTRAARLVDSMEEKGIVGPYDGRNPRKIMLSKNDYLAQFEK